MNNTNNNQQGASSHNNNNVNTNLGVNKANMVNALIQVAIAAACVIGVLFNVEQANAIIDHANDLSLPSTLQPTASAIANDIIATNPGVQGLHSMPAPVSASAPAAHSAPGAGSSTAELFEQFQTDFLVEMTSPDRPSSQANTEAYASQSQGNPTCGEHDTHWPRSSFRRRTAADPTGPQGTGGSGNGGGNSDDSDNTDSDAGGSGGTTTNMGMG